MGGAGGGRGAWLVAAVLLGVACGAPAGEGAEGAPRRDRSPQGAEPEPATQEVPEPTGTDATQRLLLDWMQELRLEGPGRAPVRVVVDGPGFDAALELRPAGAEDPAQLVLAGPARSPVHARDLMVATFYARAVGPSAWARVEYRFEHAAGAPRSAQWGVRVGTEWRRIQVPFVVKGDQAAGASRMALAVALHGEALQLAELQLVNHGQVHPSALPLNNTAYPGREPAAAWREEARARIERLRKADLEVRVVDAGGSPLQGARVHVRMRRHAFAFGSAVAAQRLLADSTDGARYRDRVVRSFNTVVLENDLKWPQWESASARAQTLQALQWLRGRGIAVRGHTLVWGHSSGQPARIRQLLEAPSPDAAAIQGELRAHIADEATALQGQVAEWDVVNEAWSEDAYVRVLGAEALSEWFTRARAADPSARLLYNDFTLLSLGALDPEATDSYARTVELLQARRAPLGALGEQGHFLDGVLMPPERVWDQLDRFAGYGLPIRITELDVNVADEALQADYLRDFMTACFSHPSVDGILLWGFWQGQHWMPNAGLWRRDWSIKPSGQAWLDLVEREWWTDVEHTTDATGTVRVRGFLGDYSVEVAAAGRTATVRPSLPREGRSVTVALPR